MNTIQKTSALFAILVAFSQTACGMSPLANHSTPDRTPRSEGQAAIVDLSSLNCDLRFAMQNLCAQLVWVKEPKADAEGAFKLYFFTRDAATQVTTMAEPNAASVFVKLWMTSMGHGSQKVVVSHAKDQNGIDLVGVFDATEVMFVMRGTWDIVVQLRDNTGSVIDSAQLGYRAQ